MRRTMKMGLWMLICIVAMSVMTSCSKDDDEKEDNREEQLYVRPLGGISAVVHQVL